jgi:predicted porin
MKRTTWTVAVIAASVASSAMAQMSVYKNDEAGADLSIYGKVNMAVEAYDVNGLKESTDADGVRVQSHSSRLGVKAGQKVTDDLKAVMQVEAGVALTGADDGSTPFFATRNTYVGLASKAAGEIRFGRHDVAYKMMTTKDNLFPDAWGENDAIISEGAARADDTVIYLSPKWNDLQVLASASLTDLQEYSSDKLVATNATPVLDKGQCASAGIQYDGKIGFLGLGFESQESDRLASTNAKSGYDSAVLSIGSPKMAGFQVVGATELRDGKGKSNEKNYSVGVAQDVTDRLTVKANYGWKDVDATDANSELLTAGVSYTASKSLEFYAVYAQIANDDKAKLDFSDGPIGKTTSSSSALSAGDDVGGISLGTVYSF